MSFDGMSSSDKTLDFGSSNEGLNPSVPATPLGAIVALCANKSCRNPNLQPRWKLCPKCREFYREYNRERTAAYVSAGLCVTCSKERGLDGTKTMCRECAEHMVKRTAKPAKRKVKVKTPRQRRLNFTDYSKFARKGGLKGGPARAAALSPERRREIALIANAARNATVDTQQQLV